MTYRRLLPAAALAAALVIPPAAHADAPWSAPVAVPGAPGQAKAAADVLLTRTRGGAVAFGVGPSFPGTTLGRSVLGAGFAPQAASQWPGGDDFDTSFGSFAAADRLIFAGSNGHQRVVIGTASGPGADWKTSLRGPTTGGAHTATAAAPHGGAAAVFGTFEKSTGYVYLVRQPGTSGLAPTQKLSARGKIRSVAVAVNAKGDVLAAWDRSGHLESRMWIASSKRLTAVQQLGTTDVASHLTVALGDDRRAIVAWIDQRVSEGGAAKGKVMATARSASRGFLAPKQLDTYGVDQVAGGIGIKAAYTGNGMGLIGWSGDTAIHAVRVDGRAIGTPQDVAPVPATDLGEFGLGDLATSHDSDRAVITWTAPGSGVNGQNQASVWPAGGNAFGPIENLSGADHAVSRPSAAFDYATNTIVVSWTSSTAGASPDVDVTTRPAP